jgi:hypothetical protein
MFAVRAGIVVNCEREKAFPLISSTLPKSEIVVRLDIKNEYSPIPSPFSKS